MIPCLKTEFYSPCKPSEKSPTPWTQSSFAHLSSIYKSQSSISFGRVFQLLYSRTIDGVLNKSENWALPLNRPLVSNQYVLFNIRRFSVYLLNTIHDVDVLMIHTTTLPILTTTNPFHRLRKTCLNLSWCKMQMIVSYRARCWTKWCTVFLCLREVEMGNWLPQIMALPLSSGEMCFGLVKVSNGKEIACPSNDSLKRINCSNRRARYEQTLMNRQFSHGKIFLNEFGDVKLDLWNPNLFHTFLTTSTSLFVANAFLYEGGNPQHPKKQLSTLIPVQLTIHQVSVMYSSY